MSEQLKQLDFSYTVGGEKRPNVIAQFSMVLDRLGYQQETMLIVGLDNGKIFRPALEAIYSSTGELDLKRPSTASAESGLSYEAISVPENVQGLLPFIKQSKKEINKSNNEDSDENKMQFLQEQIANRYPVVIGDAKLSVVPTTVFEIAEGGKITSFAADE